MRTDAIQENDAIFMKERRRSARLAVGGQFAMLPSALDVQVLDISVAGVLLHSPHPLDPGTRGCLRLNIWGSAFAADVEVRRVEPVVDGGRDQGFGIGAVFVAITPENQQLIERFASQ